MKSLGEIESINVKAYFSPYCENFLFVHSIVKIKGEDVLHVLDNIDRYVLETRGFDSCFDQLMYRVKSKIIDEVRKHSQNARAGAGDKET